MPNGQPQERGPWEDYKLPAAVIAHGPWDDYQPPTRVASWRDDPCAHFLKAAETLLKTPVASHLVGGETVSSIIERHLPAREAGGVKGQFADAARLASGLADFAGSPEGFANLFLSVAFPPAIPFQAATYASASGAEIPELAQKYYHERTPDNLQNLLTAGAFTAGLGAGAGKAARLAPSSITEGLEAGKANLQQIGEALPPIPLVGKAAFEARAKTSAVKAAETKANNLAAALETGGKPSPGVRTFEDITSGAYLEDLRAEAARQKVVPGQFIGRKGYGVAEKLTGTVRKGLDDGYKALVDPIRDRPASVAAKQAAKDFALKLEADAAFMDAISKTNNLDQVRAIMNQIGTAETIGELDAARLAYNRIGGKFYGKTGQAQYEGSVIQEAMSEAANSIREPLYEEIANNYDALSAPEIRAFQKRHGKAIQADNLMRQTATRLSSAESEQLSPHSLANRIREAASGLTMGRPAHAVGAVVQREFGPRDTSLFNTRMRRVLDKLEPSKAFQGISPGPPAPPPAPAVRVAPAPGRPTPVAPLPAPAAEPVVPRETPAIPEPPPVPPSPLRQALDARKQAGTPQGNAKLALQYLDSHEKYTAVSEGKFAAFVKRELGIDLEAEPTRLPEAEAGLKLLAAGKKAARVRETPQTPPENAVIPQNAPPARPEAPLAIAAPPEAVRPVQEPRPVEPPAGAKAKTPAKVTERAKGESPAEKLQALIDSGEISSTPVLRRLIADAKTEAANLKLRKRFATEQVKKVYEEIMARKTKGTESPVSAATGGFAVFNSKMKQYGPRFETKEQAQKWLEKKITSPMGRAQFYIEGVPKE